MMGAGWMIYLVRYLDSLMQESDCITVMLTLAVKLIILCVVSYRLIKQSYLEIALSYLYFAKGNEDVSETDELVPSKSSVCVPCFGKWPLQNRKYLLCILPYYYLQWLIHHTDTECPPRKITQKNHIIEFYLFWCYLSWIIIFKIFFCIK